MQIQDEDIQRLFGEKLKQNYPLSNVTTFRIGGPAKWYIEAVSSGDLIDYVFKSRQSGLPMLLLGGGSNVLVGDHGFNGIVIKNNTRTFSVCAMKGNSRGKVSQKQVFLRSDSGVPFNQLVRYSIDSGLAGLEMHLGLPGTVGGAVFMNSKWMRPRGFVGDVLYQATIITPKNEIKTVPGSYFQFAYGYSQLQKTGDILIEAIFKLKSVKKEDLWNIANRSITDRRQLQPQGVKSAGCIFKNISAEEATGHDIPDGCTSSGYLIDHAGMKNVRVGGAYVSDQHANFIINDGSASAADVVNLIDIIKQKVAEKYGINLREEIFRVGEF